MKSCRVGSHTFNDMLSPLLVAILNTFKFSSAQLFDVLHQALVTKIKDGGGVGVVGVVIFSATRHSFRP